MLKKKKKTKEYYLLGCCILQLKLGSRSALFCKQASGSSLASPGYKFLLQAESLLTLSSVLSCTQKLLRGKHSSSKGRSKLPLNGSTWTEQQQLRQQNCQPLSLLPSYPFLQLIP